MENGYQTQEELNKLIAQKEELKKAIRIIADNQEEMAYQENKARDLLEQTAWICKGNESVYNQICQNQQMLQEIRMKREMMIDDGLDAIEKKIKKISEEEEIYHEEYLRERGRTEWD